MWCLILVSSFSDWVIWHPRYLNVFVNVMKCSLLSPKMMSLGSGHFQFIISFGFAGKYIASVLENLILFPSELWVLMCIRSPKHQKCAN